MLVFRRLLRGYRRGLVARAGLPVGSANTVLAVVTACRRHRDAGGRDPPSRAMVLPVASGRLVARSFGGTMRWAVAISIASLVAGLAPADLDRARGRSC
jgi:hypothetical protein